MLNALVQNDGQPGKKAIVVGASADIGAALCEDWIEKGWEVYGTYRTKIRINSFFQD